MLESSSALADAPRDRYRIERELGAGGMATVYLAEDLKHRRKVAIKVLRPGSRPRVKGRDARGEEGIWSVPIAGGPGGGPGRHGGRHCSR